MRSEQITQVGSALSQARRLARPRNIDLRSIGSMQEAQQIQDAAGEAYDGAIRGYTLVATSAATARVLNCSTPVVGKLFDEHLFDSGAQIDLPYSMLGVGAQFIFVIGSPLLSPTTLKMVQDSIVSCHLGIQLLGRRVKHTVPLNEWSATADFALDVGCVRGPRIDCWDRIELENTEVSLQLNGHRITGGRGLDVLGSPIAAVVWLSRFLIARGVTLQAGDMVATGSCTGVAQVAPRQRVCAVFDRLGNVELDLQ